MTNTQVGAVINGQHCTKCGTDSLAYQPSGRYPADNATGQAADCCCQPKAHTQMNDAAGRAPDCFQFDMHVEFPPAFLCHNTKPA